MKYPLKIQNINFNNIIYSNLNINDNRKNILFKYNNNESLIIQTPELINMNKPLLKNDIFNIYVKLESNNKKLDYFIKFINNLDDHIKNLNHPYLNNKNKIFKKTINNINNDINYFKIKINKNEKIRILKKRNELYDITELYDNLKVKIIIDFTGIWIKKKNDIYYYGIYLKPLLILCFVLLLFQIGLGIQIRESVDWIIKTSEGVDRTNLIEMVPWIFYVHRSFSWIIFAVSAFLLYKIYSQSKRNYRKPTSLYKSFLLICDELKKKPIFLYSFICQNHSLTHEVLIKIF